MRVLVTGSSGYIGSVLVPILARAGHDVVCTDLGLYRECGLVAGSPAPDGRDVREFGPGDVDGFDAIIALAALSNDPLGDLDPSLTYAVNHRAVVDIAKLAKDAGVGRFLFASSCSLYGAAGQDLVDESAPMSAVTPYGQSKVLAEQGLSTLADDDFSPTYLRNATVYGVSPALRLDIVVNNLTAWAVATGRIVLVSDGTPWRPQVHVQDVSQAFLTILEAPRQLIHDEAFNVGRTDENFQVRDIATMVKDVVPNAVLEMPDAIDPDIRSYRVDFSKLARTFPDLDLQWTVRRGIEELAGAFADAGLSEGDFDRYTRLAEITRLIETGRLTTDLAWQ